MRLTLRTLLAYLDDILDSADREELSKKIETSDFANDLIHRTRDTMRRLRLSAPQPLGTGTALDPNSIAEYLDNVLPPDAVGDFERICLESDVHLAEVASCHHVLTMVLGEPAAVDLEARQRMYTIPTEIAAYKRLRIEPAHVAPAAVGAAVATPPSQSFAADSPATDTRPIPSEIPDYLRPSLGARLRGALVIAASALLMGATIYFAFGLFGWFGSEPELAAISTEAISPPTADESSQAESPEPTAEAPAVADSSDSSAAASTSEEASAVAAGGTTNAPPEAAGPPPILSPGVSTPEAELVAGSSPVTPIAPFETDSPYSVPEETPDRYGESNPDPAASTGDTPPALRLQPGPVAEATPAGEPSPPVAPPAEATRVASTMETASGAAVSAADAAGGAVPIVPAAEPDNKLGTYLGGKTVLLRYDEQEGTWLRLKPHTTVNVGDRLLALPLYRPRITLNSGVYLELVGGTQIKLSAAEPLGTGSNAISAKSPRIEVIYGRVVLVNVNTSADGNYLQVSLGTTVGDVQLAPNATLAVQVERKYVPGRDPRRTPAPVLASFYAPNGNVVWTDSVGVRALDAPGRWAVADGVPTDVMADQTSPEWIDRDPVELLSEQRHGAPVIEQSLAPDRPIDNQLLELYQGSGRREVKSLAARCSVHVGQFVPFIEALRDSDQKSVWRMHIETLRSAMALSPESAESIWDTLVVQRGERAAADLYEMLCGYDESQIGRTQAEMEVGAIAHLIDRLEDDNLDYRVLAVDNLREITGKTLMPNPAGTPNEREQGIRHWRTRLKSGELTPEGEP